MAQSPATHGSVVAFEGNHDTISTQLRLLPTSSKVLIVPPLEQFLDKQTAPLASDLRATILYIHNGAAKRAETVDTFLHGGASDSKKLVFLNGGTAAATAKCIAAIRKHYVNTTLEEAEFIYHELVRNGVAGLQRSKPYHRKASSSGTVSDNASEDEAEEEEEAEDELDDPISRAMKAADALDRETESLQPSNELDLTTAAARPRSMSLPGGYFPDDIENAPPFYVFGGPGSSRSLPTLNIQKAIVQKMIARDLELIDLCAKSDSKDARSTALRALQSLEARLGTSDGEPPSPRCIGEPYFFRGQAHDGVLASPTTGCGSQPGSPAVVMNAQLVDMRCSDTATCHSHRRIKSVDRVYAAGIRNQEISLCRDSKPDDGARRSFQPLVESVPKVCEKPVLRSKYYSEIPRATFCKPVKTTIKRGPPSPLNLVSALSRPASYSGSYYTNKVKYVNQSTETERSYVDRGVDAIEPHLLDLQLDQHHGLPLDAPFEVVLPMCEDLVIQFNNEKNDEVLSTMIAGLREGTYPVSLPPLLPENEEDLDSSRSSTSSHDSLPPVSDEGYCTMPTNTAPTSLFPTDTDDYDPFASHGDYLRRADSPVCNGRTSSDKHNTSVQMLSLSPKESTPPATSRSGLHQEKSFHAFQTTDCRNAVGIQNSLRSILSIYFPPQEGGMDNFKFSSLPEMGGMWQPVFRDGDVNGSQSRGTNIDLILAIGGQKGVERSLLSAISGSLEKLGSKSNGITRSRRLDLR